MITISIKIRRLLEIYTLVLVSVGVNLTAGVQIQAAPALSILSDYVCTQSGPNSRLWRNSAGQTVTEIATGMNYWDGQQWTTSDPSFQITADGTGFIADKIQDRTRLAANLNCVGAVTVTTPDNVTLRSTPVALGLYDPVSGKSLVVATLTNTPGTLLDAQHIVYNRAFVGGGFAADIVYSLPDAGSFHQDVVFVGFDREFDPTAWGFPADSTNTLQIQVYTEFYDAPQPQREERPIYVEQDPATAVSPDLMDYSLDFGHYVFGPGHAYVGMTNNSFGNGVRVAKDFVTSDGRKFLVESVPYRWLVDDLRNLPPVRTSSLKHPPEAKKMKVAAASVPLLREAVKPFVKRTASADKSIVLAEMSSGVVLDYIVTVSSLNEPTIYTSDTTYFVSGNVTESSPVTMESAVFKFPTNSSSGPSLFLDGALTMATTNYRPAIVTAADDNTAGATLNTTIWSGYTGNPSGKRYGNPALAFGSSGNVALNNVRFCYSGQAVENKSFNGQTVAVSHCQFVNCLKGILVDGALSGSYNVSLTINNCLMADVVNVFDTDRNLALTGNAFNCTFDTATSLFSLAGTTTGNFAFTNSVLTQITTNGLTGSFSLTGGNNGFYKCPTFGTSYVSNSSNPYQIVGEGNYYLVTNCPFLTNGTTNISVALLSQLEAKTTLAPSFLTNAITNNTTLSPVVPRDTNGVAIGFHYDPLDYIAACSVTNATLLLTNGVSLAYYDNLGIWLQDGSSLVSQGTPGQRNYLVYYGSVQEQPGEVTNSLAQALPIAPIPFGSAANPSIFLRLTTICAPTGETNLLNTADTGQVISGLTLRDCEIYGSGANWLMNESANTPTIGLTNNIFYRTPFAVSNSSTITSFNNLFYGTTNTNAFTISIRHRSGTSSNTNQNNAFDGVTASLDGTVGYNAYLNGGTNATIQTNDIQTNLTWVAGPLGDYYQATNSPLLNMGSTSASNVDLFYYTVLTNGTIDGSNMVSIGYHYIPVGSNGSPAIFTNLTTNCTVTNGNPFTIAVSDPATGWPYVCAGGLVSVTATPSTNLAGLEDIFTTVGDYASSSTTNSVVDLPGSSIDSIWWVAGGAPFSGSGAGSNAMFTPTGCGNGTLVFYMTYQESSFCGETTNTVALTTSYTAVGLAYTPTNFTNCLLVSSSPTSQTYAVPVSSTPGSTLTLVPTPFPAVSTNNLPPCLTNGILTNAVYVTNTAPGTFTNIFTNGTCFVTNIIIVTQPPQAAHMAYWRFNTPNLEGEEGQVPITSNSLELVPDWSTDAVSLTNYQSCDASQLAYNVYDTNGTLVTTNIVCSNGTVRFWYQPNWSSTNTDAFHGNTEATLFRSGEDPNNYWGLLTKFSGGTDLMQFADASNQYSILSYGFDYDGLTGVPVNFQANLWYQITFTYTPTNIALYTNGVLLATGNMPFASNGVPLFSAGNGVAFYPALNYQQANGFVVGSLTGSCQNSPAQGVIDELETFNTALSPQEVSAGFPTFAGSTNAMQDTYYVGRSDELQALVDGIPPSATNTNVVQCRLGYWRFDSDLLMSEQGQFPLSFNDVGLVPSWSDTALNITSDTGSQVTYWDVFTNGWANINCRQGTLRFWFKPNSASSSGPFIYMGSTNGGDEWALELTNGNTIKFVTQTNSLGVDTVLNANVSLSTTNWTQIVLTYGPTNCALYTNGVLATSGGGNTNWPSLANRNLGMVIGNSTAYNTSINGQFDEIETFNYQLNSNDIATNFQIVQAVDSDLNGIPDYLEDIILPVSRPYLGSPVIITGTVEAEQFDMGGPGIAYSNIAANPPSSYRPTGMFITNCDDLGLGYCLDQTRAGEWVQYTINVLEPYTYTIETRVEGIGTNGIFECEFTNSSGFFTNTGPLTITSTNWADVSAVVYLPAGTNLMKLHFLTNGTGSSYVGRFNYISLYPWWPTGFTSTRTNTITIGQLSTNNDWADAVNNAAVIQSNVNAVAASGGGTVILPAGTYYVSQYYPNETNGANQNAAVVITNSNVEIAGAGKTNTTVIGYNRATTVFYLGMSTNFWYGPSYPCTNFILRDMTVQAQPHLEVAGMNGTNTVFDLDELNPAPYPGELDDTGFLTAFSGILSNQNSCNLLITNCQFLFGNFSIGLINSISNCMVTHCDFTIWGGSNVYTNPAVYIGSVGIFCGGTPNYNVTIVDNTYDGNANLVPSTNYPVGYVTTNTSEQLGPDGFVNFQSGGNYFIARNCITNYELEGIQLDGGPNAVVRNGYYTLLNDPSCCALAISPGGAYGYLNNSNVDNYHTCFIGNQIYGGRTGLEEGSDDSPLFSVNFSGNDLTLAPPLGEGDLPGPMFGDRTEVAANVFGNTLQAGGYGFLFDTLCIHATIMNNNFANATYRGIGMDGGSSSLQTAIVINNIIGEGSTFHVELPYTNSFGWFFYSNQYVDAHTNIIPAFFDPISSLAHVSP